MICFGVDTKEKVSVIGVGYSGAQYIQERGYDVEELVVFEQNSNAAICMSQCPRKKEQGILTQAYLKFRKQVLYMVTV